VSLMQRVCVILLIVLFSVVLLTACEERPILTNQKDFVLSNRTMPIEPFDQAMYDMADIVWGGRLYDKWWTLNDGTMSPAPAETATTHELWPATNTAKAGETTWRCKSCHGWDYRGGAGAYGDPASSYFTEIKGLLPIPNGDQPTLVTPEEVYNFLHDGMVNNISHGLSALVNDDMAFYALTKFIFTMRDEAAVGRAPNDFIDDATKATTGIEADGAAHFALAITEGGCAACHGDDGRLLDFVDGDTTTLPNKFVDTYALSNPWETLHKIRFGQPGSTPFMTGLDEIASLAGQDTIQMAIDMIAYAQTSLVPVSVPATPFDQAMYDMADLVWGGRLYDKWWSLQDGTMMPTPPAELATTHPLWPATNTAKSGETTWRCKSCHGWDYRGAAGVYGDPASSYLTGIKGLIPITDGPQPTLTTPEEIYNFLHSGMLGNVPHGLGSVIQDEMAFYALTKFVTTIQEEAVAVRAPSDFIDDATRLTTGIEADGATHYAMLATDGGCVDCHGEAGKAIDFVDGDLTTMPNKFVDTYARSNPWETLHKIRFGQPGSSPYMAGVHDFASLADRDLIQYAVDIVAYAQNGLVPTTTTFDFRMYQAGMDAATPDQSGLNLARGGILYDKWWTDVDETLPLVVPPDIVGVDHALWTPLATNLTPKVGDTTWRCKSCHGWDYVGVDGAYGTPGGSYETGIKGFVLSNGVHPMLTEPVAIYDFLHSGTVTTAGDHGFSQWLTEMDLYALTRMVTQVQAEAMSGKAPNDFINLADKTVPGGDPVHGLDFYNLEVTAGGCGGTCHGVDGTLRDLDDGDLATVPNVFVADYAQGNPWETLHKIRFGHPGSIMPGFTDYQNPTLGLHEAVDLLSYSVSDLNLPAFFGYYPFNKPNKGD